MGIVEWYLILLGWSCQVGALVRLAFGRSRVVSVGYVLVALAGSLMLLACALLRQDIVLAISQIVVGCCYVRFAYFSHKITP